MWTIRSKTGNKATPWLRLAKAAITPALHILFALSIIFTPYIAIAQATEYIINGDFESGNLPHCWAQGDYASNWETNRKYDTYQNYQLYLHSPDYFDNTMNFYNENCSGEYGNSDGASKLNIGAYSGNRYMGLSTYELIQQEYNSSLVPGRHYTVSFEAMLGTEFPSTWSGTSTIKIYLAKSKVKYRSQNDASEFCTEDYVTYQDGLFQDIREIGSLELNIADYPPADGWKRVQASFRAWDNIDAYSWFIIDVVKNNYSPGSFSFDCVGDYVYIDNVSMQNAEFCSSHCSPDLGPITYWRNVDNTPTYGVPPTGVIVGGSPGQSFYLFIENAIGIDFTVINGWGEEIYSRYAFEPDGLHDVGFPDYWFSWNGEDQNGNFLYPEVDVLVYNLTIWNCDPGSTISYLGNELLYTPSNLDNVDGGDIVDYELDDCCDDHAYFQNTTFNSLFRKDVNDFITAGTNVTTGTQGPVVVSSNANVLFHAGSEINLLPGFTVSSGGIFHAVISDCVYGSTKMSRPSRRSSVEKDIIESAEVYQSGNSIQVWPNPSLSEILHVRVNAALAPEHTGRAKINILSVTGNLISQHEIDINVIEDVYFPTKGVYLLKAYDIHDQILGTVKVVVL